MIGRLNGEFPPPIDPLLYRHNKKDKKDTLDPIYYHDGDDDNNKSGFKTIPDSDELRCEKIRQQPVNYNTNKRPAHIQPDSPVLQPQHKPIQGKYYDSLGKLSERRLKLEEFRILLDKNNHPQTASEILTSATILANHGDDVFIEKKLTLLRNIDRVKSGYSGQ